MQLKSVPKIILIVAIVIAIISLYILTIFKTPAKPIAGQGMMIDKGAKIGGDFVLIDHNGKIFNSNMLKGKISLIYFGFTFCPDICPTSLQKVGLVISELEKRNIDINSLFITIDPERDDHKILKEYVENFHPKLIGLTGNDEQIKEVADKFKVFYSKSNVEYKEDQYMVDHTSFIYLMDENGEFDRLFYMNSKPDEIFEYILQKTAS